MWAPNEQLLGAGLSAPSPGDDLQLVSAIRLLSESARSDLSWKLVAMVYVFAVAMPLAMTNDQTSMSFSLRSFLAISPAVEKPLKRLNGKWNPRTGTCWRACSSKFRPAPLASKHSRSYRWFLPLKYFCGGGPGTGKRISLPWLLLRCCSALRRWVEDSVRYANLQLQRLARLAGLRGSYVEAGICRGVSNEWAPLQDPYSWFQDRGRSSFEQNLLDSFSFHSIGQNVDDIRFILLSWGRIWGQKKLHDTYLSLYIWVALPCADGLRFGCKVSPLEAELPHSSLV